MQNAILNTIMCAGYLRIRIFNVSFIEESKVTVGQYLYYTMLVIPNEGIDQPRNLNKSFLL